MRFHITFFKKNGLEQKNPRRRATIGFDGDSYSTDIASVAFGGALISSPFF
jgi:hypothetical protein